MDSRTPSEDSSLAVATATAPAAVHPSLWTQVWRRKQLGILPEFQLPFIAWFAGIALVLGAGLSSAFYWTLHSISERVEQMGLPAGHFLPRYIAEQQRELGWHLLTTAGLSVVFLILSGLLLSHQIAGPLYRLKSQMQKAAHTGDLTLVSFRKRDFFQGLAQDYNQLLKRWK